MTDVPILQAGDIIHIQSPKMGQRAINAIVAGYKEHRVIIQGWTELPGLHEIKIVAIFRAKQPLYPPMPRDR